MTTTRFQSAQREHYHQVLSTLGVTRWAKRGAMVVPMCDLSSELVGAADKITEQVIEQEIKKQPTTQKQITAQQTDGQNSQESQASKQPYSQPENNSSSLPEAQTNSITDLCPAFSLYAVVYKHWLLVVDGSMMLAENAAVLTLWQNLTTALATESNQKRLPVQQFDFPLLDKPNTHTFACASAAVAGWLYSISKKVSPVEQGSGQQNICVGLLSAVDDKLFANNPSNNLANDNAVVDLTQLTPQIEVVTLPTLAQMLTDWRLKKTLWQQLNTEI